MTYLDFNGQPRGLSRRRLDSGSLMKAEAEAKVEGKIQTLFFLNLDLSLNLPLAGGLFQHSAELLLVIGFKVRILYTAKLLLEASAFAPSDSIMVTSLLNQIFGSKNDREIKA
ncbi:MAG: hypothetical protein AAB177_12455, partial [Nitrospirota bacterium]